MRLQHRYALTVLFLVSVLYVLTSGNNNNSGEQYADRKHQRDTNKAGHENDKKKAENTVIDDNEPDATIEDTLFERQLEDALGNELLDAAKCNMERCFDLSLCRKHGFTVYVYPRQEDINGKISKLFADVIDSIKRSHYITDDPERACVKVLTIDAMDRDPLSKDRFVKNFGGRLANINGWNGGRNHIIFNLFSGTWPEYLEELGFDLGYAILAKASISKEKYRPAFDISLPLWGDKHPLRGAFKSPMKTPHWDPLGKYLVSFKGKRYLNGIGSETRNSLHYIHDGQQSIMLTTCKHGKNWERNCENKDCLDKCEADNANYDHWEYEQLIHDSTFCLVPRGRRLGSFRFIETMQQACVPVVLANGWVLPFSEIIDWDRALIDWDERLLIELRNHLVDISPSKIFKMRQQGALLYNMYFSSIDQIIRTTFEIIRERIFPEARRERNVWNSKPGGLAILPGVPPSLTPFYTELNDVQPESQFTALIHAVQTVPSSASPIIKLIKSLWKSQSCGQVIVLWACEHPPPALSRWPASPEGKSFVLLKDHELKMTNRLKPFDEIRHEAVLSLDNDVTLHQEEIDFSFSVWQAFPHRIVGFPSRRHQYHERMNKYAYTSKPGNEYSLVLTGAAFIHIYYYRLFASLPPSSIAKVDEYANCEDILVNFMVSHVTGLPPIKVTQKKQYMTRPDSNEPEPIRGKLSSHWDNSTHFAERQKCLAQFSGDFGYVPLVNSRVRLDPLLFKDNVARYRKRYPDVDTVEP